MSTIELNTKTDITQPTPLRISAPTGIPTGDLILQPELDGPTFQAQADGQDKVIAIVSNLKAGEIKRYNLAASSTASPGVSLKEEDGSLELHLPEGHFSSYHYGSDIIRPYLWPVFGPGQKRVTRNYPMQDMDGEERDHPHHKSIWTAFDEVNDVNNWHDSAGHGFIRHTEFLVQQQGSVFGGFTARGVWTSHDSKPVLDEVRNVRLYNVGPERRILDYSVILTANYGDVTFGDTKEGGILSVRVATSMDGARGGLIENAAGGRGEKECWGQRSVWCDYSGTVEDQIFGIAVLDHPSNHNHPPRWHARDYGLMTTNPLSNGAFTGVEKTPATLKNGENWSFRYRIIIHSGDAREGQVAESYSVFAE